MQRWFRTGRLVARSIHLISLPPDRFGLWAMPTFVTHILYRIIERDEDTLPDDARDAIFADVIQREDDWYDYVDPDGIIMNIRYRDFVFPAVNGTDATITNPTSIERQHAVIPMMSDGLVLDAQNPVLLDHGVARTRCRQYSDRLRYHSPMIITFIRQTSEARAISSCLFGIGR